MPDRSPCAGRTGPSPRWCASCSPGSGGGRGIGATTAEVLAAAPGTALTFTDVSPIFVGAARAKFTDPTVRFAVFDLEGEYRPQGLLPNSFDVIVAGDVLHAVRDVDESLARLRELLVPAAW